jgi:hypothetical protein
MGKFAQASKPNAMALAIARDAEAVMLGSMSGLGDRISSAICASLCATQVTTALKCARVVHRVA